MRNLCCKCPHYYNEQSYCGEYDCGCRVFGAEFDRCPSFWDNDGEADESEMGCNVHPKRIEFLLMRENKRLDAYIERDSKDNKLVKHYSVLPKEERGYKAYRKDGTWMGFWTDDYRPNLKGGHTHNHVFNAVNRHTFRKKKQRLKAKNRKFLFDRSPKETLEDSLNHWAIFKEIFYNKV